MMKFQNLFFPEKIGSYYLFRKKIVGIHCTLQAVYATVFVAHARTITLVDSLQHDLTQEEGTLAEKTATGIATLLKKIGSYDSLVTTLTSSQMLCKELHFPFLTKEKIKLVLSYEIEQYLPFPLGDATFDFFITKTYPETHFSDCIVAATQKKYLQDYLQLFIKAGATPSVVTVDIFNVYELYKTAFDPASFEEYSALVVVDDNAIQITYLHYNQLKAVRSIPKNLTSLDDKTIQLLFFTLQSFSQEYGSLQKVLFITADARLSSQAQDKLAAPCQLLKTEQLVSLLPITIDLSQKRDSLNIFSLAAAFPSELTDNFTLTTEETSEAEMGFFKKQIITTAFLTITLLTVLIGYTFFETYTLSSAINTTKETIIKDLRKNFTTIKSSNVNDALKAAKKEITKEEEVWFAFSNQTRRSFLKSLSILSAKIEREVLGLQLKKMVMNKDTILIEGTVRNFDALERLEQELKDTNLFVSVPDLQKTEFSVPLTLLSQGDVS